MHATPSFLPKEAVSYVRPLAKRPVECEMWLQEGCLAVEVAPKVEKSGLIYLPDDVSQKLRVDCGWVIGVGEGIPLKNGDPVVLKHNTGKEVDGFSFKGFKADKVKFYGWAGGAMVDDRAYGEVLIPPFKTEWFESVIGFFEDGEVVPTGTNVMLRLKVEETVGSLIVPDKHRERFCDAAIFRLGPSANLNGYEALEVGKTALFYDGFLEGPGASWIGDGLVIVPREAVLAVYDE